MYNAHFFNQNFNIKTRGAHYTWVYLYKCGNVEKYHICDLKVGVRIIRGYLQYVPEPAPGAGAGVAAAGGGAGGGGAATGSCGGIFGCK